MKAGFYRGPGDFAVTDIAEPTLAAPDEVLVEVEVAGMCGTDLHIVSVPQMHPAAPGIVLGHEFVGRVVEVGPKVSGLSRGDRVVAAPNIWCGQCGSCRAGRRKHCDNNRALGISINGGFTRFVVAPARVLYPVPAGIPPEQALFAEPLSCCMNGVLRLGSLVGARAAVLGAGPIGQYFIRLLRHFGAGSVLAVEPVEHRRKTALGSGADHVLDPTGTDVAGAVSKWAGGRGADVVIDTVGSLLPVACAAARPGGRILLFGMDTTAESRVMPFDLVRNEKTIFGCFIDNDQVPLCLDVIPSLRLGELITHRVSLNDIDQGFAAVRDGTAMKVLVLPGAA
ncbi:MAG TPA: alcohol dehydrogenase catalytic domain-containing protein [Longimicrobium sp.]|jgi:threonine dehydrogenase-like Zn-dependent dehydrogenase